MAALAPSASPRTATGQTPPSQWELDTPEALLAEAELRECLEKTIASLSEMQSSVLLLRERQGLEPEEICNLLDLSLSNVRVLLHRARLKVFATLEAFRGDRPMLSCKDLAGAAPATISMASCACASALACVRTWPCACIAGASSGS